mgnify:FL=1
MEHHQSANRLYIRAGSTPAHSLLWFTGMAEGGEEIHRLPDAEHLSELASQPSAQNICLIIPASEVIFRQITLPPRPGKNPRQMIAYLTEESIASDVDALHWVVLHREGQTLFVAGVEADFLGSWLQKFSHAGLRVKHVFIDALLLPLPEEGWSAARIDNQWLLRQSKYSACLAEQVLLETLLDIAKPESLYYHGQEQDVPAHWVRAEPPIHALITMKNNCPSAVNLLQGEFAVREEEPAWGRHLQRIATAMVVFTLVLIIGTKLFTWWQVSQQESLLKNEMLALHQTWFPQDKHTRNLKFYF